MTTKVYCELYHDPCPSCRGSVAGMETVAGRAVNTEGVGGSARPPPQFIAEHLTLLLPGADCAHHINIRPFGFSDLPTALSELNLLLTM